MSRTLRLPLAAVLALAVAGPARAAAPAPAAAPVNLALPYPAKAPIVVHVNGFERAKERLGKMLEALPTAEGKQFTQGLDAGLKHLLADRKLDDVPKDGRVFVVVHDIGKLMEEEPAVAVLVPVTDYKAFKGSFLTPAERKTVADAGNGVESVKSAAAGDERTLYLAAVKGYVAVSPSKETAEEYAGKYTPAQSGALGTDLSGSFLNADVSLYVNMDVINDKYGEQIRQFKMLIDFALGQAQMGGMIPGLDKKQLDLAKTMIGGLVQGVEDAKGIVIGIEFRPEGLNVRGQVRFADDTQSADLLKTETPTALADLAKLPRGMNTYGGSKFGKKLSELSKKFAMEYLAAEDDEKGAARLEKLLADVAAAGPQGELSAGSPPDVALTVTAYKDAAKAAAAQVKLYQGLVAGGKFVNIVLKDKPKVTEAAQTYRGFTLAEIRLTLDFEATVAAMPENTREMAMGQFKRLMGEKPTFWTGTDGKVLVQVTGKDWDAAKKVLDDYLDGKAAVGGDAGFRVTRQNLPPEATMLALLETGQVVTLLVDQAKAVTQMLPGGGGIPPLGKVKPAKGDASYIGVALTLKPQVATADLFVPGGAMNTATKMLGPVFRTVE